jgi:hypothetical protein
VVCVCVLQRCTYLSVINGIVVYVWGEGGDHDCICTSTYYVLLVLMGFIEFWVHNNNKYKIALCCCAETPFFSHK